jgi:CheY-like chemotaxis protein
VSGGVGTILIVEDERPMRELLAEVLEDAGHRALQAIHGGHALELIAQERPDLVIADVMMPVLGGVALCHRLKADPRTRGIPVVLMSAAGPQVAREAGAEDFLDKPFGLDAVEALARRWLA